jgi:hypothetical protein
MSEQDAELLQILIREIGEDAEVNPVLVEASGVTSQTELVSTAVQKSATGAATFWARRDGMGGRERSAPPMAP